MANVIHTNVMSLNAQRNLMKSQNDMQVSMQRLSTGLRINSAKDDAAGLAISERMTGQIRGLNQAVRNANDGISLMQTTEGALDEISSNLQRIRELAVQSANQTNSWEDRKALDAEVEQILKEIDTVADQTSFNGQKLLDGSFDTGTFQIGANSGDTITVSKLIDANVDKLGGSGVAATAEASGAADAVSGGGYAASMATGDIAIAVTANTPDGTAAATYTYDKEIEAATSAKERIDQVLEAINSLSTQSGVNAYYNEEEDKIVFTSDNGNDQFTVSGGGAGTAGFADTAATTGTVEGLKQLDIGSYAGANQAIDQVDRALKQINSKRAEFGAVQSRFESAIRSLSTQSENLSSARSRIRDTDFAVETANLTKSQILQQAGTAMLAQANMAPQSVLSLLG